LADQKIGNRGDIVWKTTPNWITALMEHVKFYMRLRKGKTPKVQRIAFSFNRSHKTYTATEQHRVIWDYIVFQRHI
jgi:hypothetical protein